MGLQEEGFLGEGGAEPAQRRSLLRIESGFYEGLEWPLDGASIVIGRGQSADLILHEATISRSHALLNYDEDCFYVQDLGSTNGVLVNGVRATRTRLSEGDELRMGRLIMRLLPDPDADGGDRGV